MFELAPPRSAKHKWAYWPIRFGWRTYYTETGGFITWGSWFVNYRYTSEVAAKHRWGWTLFIGPLLVFFGLKRPLTADYIELDRVAKAIFLCEGPTRIHYKWGVVTIERLEHE